MGTPIPQQRARCVFCGATADTGGTCHLCERGMVENGMPTWRRRALEQQQRVGRVAVWARSGGAL